MSRFIVIIMNIKNKFATNLPKKANYLALLQTVLQHNVKTISNILTVITFYSIFYSLY